MNKYYNFKYSRQFLGIFIVFMGSPITFFLKETLGFSGGSTFTIASFFLGFGLMISPQDIFRKFYKPNLPMYRMATLFLGIAFFNYIFSNPSYGFFGERYVFYRDFGNFSFIIIFFFLLLSVSNEVKDYFLPIVVSLTFLGSVCLIYSMATNPFFIIGQRASVVYGDGSTTASGNPHVYARNAFGGIFASYLMLRTKNILWKIFSITNLLLSLVVLVMTQARSILLAFIFTALLFFYFNISRKSVKNVVKGFFKPQNLLIFSLFWIALIYFLSTQTQVVNIINLYYDGVGANFSRAILTAFGMGDADAKTLDYSALGRVNSFGEFQRVLFERPWEMILGKGFRYRYLDIPILETWIDCGIVAFISYGLMNWCIFVESLKAIKSDTNPLTTFLGYFYMCYFVGLFTGGEPYGTPYWFIFCVMIRFLGIKYIQSIPNPFKKQNTNPSPIIEA